MANIYIGNLSYEASEEDLREAFGQYGQVASVNIIKDRQTGRPRGFAFVEMPDGKEAADAIKELNLHRINGRAITVNQARPRPQRPRHGGSRRGW